MSRRLPGLHRAGITGRAWADRAPLLLAGLVVALATLLAGAVPLTIRSTADRAVNDAVARAGSDADITVDTPFERDDDFEQRIRQSNLAEMLHDSADTARYRLGPDLTPVFLPPVASVTSNDVQVLDNKPGRFLALAYVAEGGGVRVQWTAGRPPQASVPPARADTAARSPSRPWPVEVGLSAPTATLLGLKPGDRIPAADLKNNALDLRVSGIFRALDPQDRGWQTDPQLLRPHVASDGHGTTRTELAALLSKDSLPDARLALDDDDLRAGVSFAPRPRSLRWQNLPALRTAVVILKGSSGATSQIDTTFTWQSGLDAVLARIRGQVLAASAQASVLLVGLVTSAVLMLLLAADLLAHRRTAVLANIRRRGASLTGIAAELLIESVAVTLAGAAVGLLLSVVLAGSASWRSALPVIAVGVLAGPALGTREAARATRGRQAPANRSARLSTRRTQRLRRVAIELLLLLAAAGAYTALRQRGLLPSGSGQSDQGLNNVLPAVAPTLGAAVGAIVLLRLLPGIAQVALARATASRRALPLLAAARAAATAKRTLPFLLVIMTSALTTFTLSVSATESHGQGDQAWRTVGADARLQATASPSLQLLAKQLSTAAGVRQAVAARVSDDVPVRVDNTTVYTHFVIVDAVAYQKLLASTPLPDAPQLSRLAATGTPALLLAAGHPVRPGEKLSVTWNGAPIALSAAGTAPAVADGDVLIVDAAAFAAAGGSSSPDTIWAVGPRATPAVTAAARPDDVVTSRQHVLARLRSAPLPAGLLHLAEASAGLLLLLGLLAVVLGAAAGAPERGETLARLRTLGLTTRQARQVAAGELLPSALLAGLGGLIVGVLLARVSLALLSLRLVTGQAAAPALVVPWLSIVPVALLGLAVVVVVVVESSSRRRERLGQVLRAGNV